MSDPAPRAKPALVSVESPLHPGRVSTVNAEKYSAVRRAMLAVLPAKPPGLAYDEMTAALVPRVPKKIFPEGMKAGWWTKTVQLDLEAKGVIVREATKPLRSTGRGKPRRTRGGRGLRLGMH